MQKFYTIQHESYKNGCKSNKPNQDRKSVWFKYPLIKSSKKGLQISKFPYGFIGVYDGHGVEYGHIIAQIAKDFFDDAIPKYWESLNLTPNKVIEQLFTLANEKIKEELISLLKSKHYEVQVESILVNDKTYSYIKYRKYNDGSWILCRGGTTCSLVIMLENNTVYHAHVGDSECIVFHPLPETGKYELKNLTKNHSPTSIEEYKRVTQNFKDKAGLFVYDIYGHQASLSNHRIFVEADTIIKNNPYDFYSSGYSLYHKNIEEDFATVFISNNAKEIIAITRGLGDFPLHSSGFSSKPNIIKYKLIDGECFIMASDGMWDVWKKSELLDKYTELIHQKNTDKMIFDELVKITCEKATKNFGSSKDDITVVMFIS